MYRRALTPKKNLSPRKKIRRGNYIVRITEDFVNFVKEINKVTGGLLFIIAPVYIKQVMDHLYRIYTVNKEKNALRKTIDGLIKNYEKVTDEEIKKDTYVKILRDDELYFALAKEHYVTPTTMEELKIQIPRQSTPRLQRLVTYGSSSQRKTTPTVDAVSEIMVRINEAKETLGRDLGPGEITRLLEEIANESNKKNSFGKSIRRRVSHRRSRRRRVSRRRSRR